MMATWDLLTVGGGLCRPLQGLGSLLSIPGTSVPGSGFYRPYGGSIAVSHISRKNERDVGAQVSFAGTRVETRQVKTCSKGTGYRRRGGIALRAPSRMCPTSGGSGRRRLASSQHSAPSLPPPAGCQSTWRL